MFAADAVLELIGNFIVGQTDVDALLNRSVGASTVRKVLQGSILSTTNDHAMAAAPVSSLPGSLFVLARNLADALPPLDLDVIKLSLHRDGDIIGLRVDVAKPDEGIILNQGADIQISLVTDARWIEPPTGTSPDPGIIIEFVAITAGPHPTISVHPSIAANGIGVKIAKGSGPLLDAGLRLEAVTVHLFGKLEPITGGVGVSGGVHLELAGLGVPLGPGGGDNSVAKGVLSDAGGSGAPPTPKFSPALAIQSHHGGNGVAVSLAGGPGDGPWYLPIQRAFGPVYLEQIGLRTTYNSTTPRKLQTISVSLDGTVSLFGISASVDKLRLTYAVNSDFFKASSWSVDLDGFAISSSIGGLTLVGALIRAELAAPLKGVDYLGMLKIGFNGYGVDLFGGYANPVDSTGSFASFFAFGALHAPLGGPPAFFITGIGIGFGINRELKPPTMETITSNPFLVAMKALGAPPNPKTQLEQMRANIAPKRGEYWVAAGISFTSFVLISGEVVVTVAFGDGLEITLLGLARAELPAPGLTLVSIELALLVRFSTKEGTILVQAQLTENSWLLTESVRLTGGFAMQAWWKGPNAGQFVVTMGGYHPKFHKAGYPVVPRLGFRWQPIDNVSIIGESYFALCSEALMAGTSFEANAHFGPAHARVSFGADGIVFFDPFWFEISAWAEISAGIKIWLLFGTVTIELSLGAKLTVSGPPIFVEGVFEICGFEVPFEFGERTNPADKALSAVEFRDKYLRAKSDAQVLQSSVVRGAVPGGRQGNGSPQKVPDGSPGNPFRVVPEFELMFITTAPAVVMNLLHKDDTTKSITTTVGDLGVAPMNSPSLDSTFQVEISKFVEPKQFEIARIKMLQRPPASFPKGVWGEAQDKNKKSVPEGKTIDAADGFTISTVLDDPAGAPAIDYHQVEIRLDHKRKPLPFVTNTANANARRATTQKMRDLTEALRPASANLNARFNIAARLLDAGGYGTLGVAALRGERNAPPLFGSLADDLVKTPAPMSPAINPTIVDHSTAQFVTRGPTVTSVLSSSMTTALPRQATTTVQNPGRAIPRLTPSLDGMRAAINRIAPASLLIREPSAVLSGRRSVAVSGSTPLTRLATSASAAVANAQPTPAGQQQLALMTRELAGGGDGAMVIRDGELVVVAMGTRPTGDGRHQVTVVGGPCRVIALAAGGNVLFDDVFDSQNQETPGRIDVPLKTDRLVLVGNGSLAAVGGALDGWYNGQSLPLLGWDMALSARSIVRFASNKLVDNRERSNGGWANTRQLSRAASITTRFDRPITALAIAIDDSYLDGRRDAASSIDMRLVGAIRSMDRDGQVVPPTVLVQGIRSILVYSIEPQRDDSARDPNVLAIIDNARNGQVSGVVGDISTVDAMVTALSDAGFDAAVGAAIPGGAGTRSVSWTTAGGQ